MLRDHRSLALTTRTTRMSEFWTQFFRWRESLVYEGIQISNDSGEVDLNSSGAGDFENDCSDAGDFQLENWAIMDDKLWSTLPEDILERIVAWLPISSFLRVRTVCKKWNAFPTCNNFLETCSQIPSKTPHLLICADCTSKPHYAYNPVLRNWYSLPLNFLPVQEKFTVTATAGGFLCLIAVRNYHSSVLYVCNPVTKTWRELPQMLRKRIPIIVAMLVNQGTRSYKLIVVGDYRESGNRSTELYDSTTNSWENSSSVPREAQVVLGAGTAVCKGTLYCPTEWPDELLTYNLESESWSIVRSAMPTCLMFPYFVDCDGLLVMVGEVRKRGARNIGIWRLEQLPGSAIKEWKEVGRMPNECFERFREIPCASFSCLGQGELIYLTTNDNLKRLVYDLSKKSWRWLPSSPNGMGGLVQGFAFDPRVDARI